VRSGDASRPTGQLPAASGGVPADLPAVDSAGTPVPPCAAVIAYSRLAFGLRTDHRQVLGVVLIVQVADPQLDAVFPGFAPSAPLGLLAAPRSPLRTV